MRLNKIKNIARSKFMSEKDLPSWVEKRRAICETCPLNFKNVPIKRRRLKDWVWYVLNGFKTQCTACGCGIKSKTKIADEYCGMENIGLEPLWDIEEEKPKTK